MKNDKSKLKAHLYISDVILIVKKIKFDGFKFHVFQDGDGYKAPYCIQAEFSLDWDGDKTPKRTRVWRIEPDSTESQVVKTVFSLIQHALDYEVRTAFFYNDQAIFAPDIDVVDLAEQKKKLKHEPENKEEAKIGSNEKIPDEVG